MAISKTGSDVGLYTKIALYFQIITTSDRETKPVTWKDSQETNPAKHSGNQIHRCVECDQLFPTQKTTNEVVLAGEMSGGCSNRGGDEFESVTLDPEHDSRPARTATTSAVGCRG